jgi:hypothetical protein
MLLYLELAGGLILLELREVGHTGPRRLVMGDTEDLAADLEEGSEVGVVGYLDLKPPPVIIGGRIGVPIDRLPRLGHEASFVDCVFG